MNILGPAPRQIDVVASVDNLVEIFQKLKVPPTRSLIGLVGELCIIYAARDTQKAIHAWRSDPTDRYDFSIENLRVEAKASANRRRIHTVSLEQASPPPSVVGLLGSLTIEHAGGGMTLAELVRRIEQRLYDHRAVMKLRTVVADTLGVNLPESWEWSFDLQQAESSLAFYNFHAIPGIRGGIPSGVSAVRFNTDLSNCFPVSNRELSSINVAARGIWAFKLSS